MAHKHIALDPTIKVLGEATTAMKSMAERQGASSPCAKYLRPMQTAVSVAMGVTPIQQQVQTQSAPIISKTKLSQMGGTAFNKGAVGSTVSASTPAVDNSSGSTSESTSRGPGQR